MPSDILASLRAGAKNKVAAQADGLELERFELCAAAEGGPLYDAFTEAWAASSCVNKMEIGFHGTPERNIVSILSEGLDPRRRCGQAFGAGEYFACGAVLATQYCRARGSGRSRRVVVFALLADPAGITSRPMTAAGEAHMVVVHRTDHQLPIGVATFSAASCEAAVARRTARNPYASHMAMQMQRQRQRQMQRQAQALATQAAQANAAGDTTRAQQLLAARARCLTRFISLGGVVRPQLPLQPSLALHGLGSGRNVGNGDSVTDRVAVAAVATADGSGVRDGAHVT